MHTVHEHTLKHSTLRLWLTNIEKHKNASDHCIAAGIWIKDFNFEACILALEYFWTVSFLFIFLQHTTLITLFYSSFSLMAAWPWTVMKVRSHLQRPWLATFQWGGTLWEYQTKGNTQTVLFGLSVSIRIRKHKLHSFTSHTHTFHIICNYEIWVKESNTIVFI